jgi:hypothetical protein
MSEHKHVLPARIKDEMRRQLKVMGFELSDGVLERFASDIDINPLLLMDPEASATALLETVTAQAIEDNLPACVSKYGDRATLVGMPLEDLRFAFGYLALVEARAAITADQLKEAMSIASQLASMRADVPA